MSGSWSVAEHRAWLESLVHPLPAEVVTVGEGGLGRVLAEEVRTVLDTPPFTNSAMDGFAVRHADLPPDQAEVVLPVVGDAPAGGGGGLRLADGQAIRIMTGAPLPDGADTVVVVEQTDHQPGVVDAPRQVRVRAPWPQPGANVRQRGEDLASGEPLLPAGTVLDAAALSALVSAGVTQVALRPRPRVGVVTTGRELLAPGVDVGPGQVPDSNAVLLAGLVLAAGADLVVQARVDDRPEQLTALLNGWPELDLVITAGGISAGAFEVVRQALAAQVGFHHVAVQPGGPQGAGRLELGGRLVPVVCLPGNPVSVFVSFHLYGAGLIAMLAGRAASSEPPMVPVVAGEGWQSPPGKVQVCPVRRVGEQVWPSHRLGSRSHLVASLPLADGLAVVPAGTGTVSAGDPLFFIGTRAGRRGW
ncbi:MAG: molybdopterin molybdotransferase MoeA [Actinomycetia bacterium]|nr:molybdopterin molybdotransferase MoeA [Actinomycetes bacterium]